MDLDIYLDGVSVKDRVIEMATDIEDSSLGKNIQGFDWEPEFLKALNAIPCNYHNYYYKSREVFEQVKQEAETEGTRAEAVRKLEKELFKLYKDPNLDMKPPQLEKRGGAHYSDAAVRLISSINNNKGDIQAVNTRNNGAIAIIPDDAAVEISCIITKDGPKPIAMGDLPVPVRGLVQQIKSFERVASEAAVTGDRNLAIFALTINPLVASDTLAIQIVDEMLEAHRKYLPQFF